MHRTRPLAIAGLLIALIAVPLATPAHAQRQLGAIQGIITDQTGGVLPGVAYNVFNTLNLNNPVSNTNSTNFGRVTSIRTPGGGLTGARLAQIGVKFLF